jgi:hypothetical protein
MLRAQGAVCHMILPHTRNVSSKCLMGTSITLALTEFAPESKYSISNNLTKVKSIMKLPRFKIIFLNLVLDALIRDMIIN